MNISSSLAAEVLGINQKRLENSLLALREGLQLTGRQGKSRELSVNHLEVLAITLLLQRDLGLALRVGLPLAQTLVNSDDGVARLGVLGSIRFDMPRLRSVLQQALASAIDDHVAPRRGRPSTRK